VLFAVALALFFFAQVAGLVMIPLGLPGTVVQLAAAAVLAWATGGESLAWSWVGVFAVLVVVGEVIEFVSGQWGAKRFGGSSTAAWGALFGGIFGAFMGVPVPVIGSVIGSFVGTFAGAIAGELYAQGGVDLRVGVGALIGRVVGTATKLAIGFAIIVLSASALLADLVGTVAS
jgi:uncharacterized protein YqgC (DUF456 family)